MPLRILSIFILIFFLFATVFPTFVSAEGTQLGATTSATWAFDSEVTAVGKNADRARQLLWWVFTHPGIHTAPVLAEVWSISRNIVYVFIVLVIVAFGVGIVLSRRASVGSTFSGIASPFSTANLPSLFYRIGGILLFVTFSYVLVVGTIQLSEVTMRFFIENVGGKDLFNVVFAGAGNSEENYTTFVGYRDINPLNREMADTSLFIVRITSFTYYIMSLLLILRTIILWFLLVIAPFLALLIPFVFIRNVGWIWIGVFFQWVFYGPMVALFLATLTKVWVSGIPFPFDFTRANCQGAGMPRPECSASGQVYRTAINILYGGPAQTLAAGNSANYVDTYAEYIIALVMLWTAIILPWLLLRIFRDYCCGAISAGNATLNSIFERMRQYPPPTPTLPISPTTATGIAVELPFRQRVEEKIREVTHTNIQNIAEISRTNTAEIARALETSVSSLSDISRLELNQEKRSQIQQTLQKLSSPERITSTREREQYATLRSALETRAQAGDRVAQTLLTATNTEKSKQVLSTSSSSSSATVASEVVMEGGRLSVAGAKTQGAFAPTRPVISVNVPSVSVIARNVSVTSLSQKVGIKEEQITQIITLLQSLGIEKATAETISKKTGVSQDKVEEVIAFVKATSSLGRPTSGKPAKVVSIGGKDVPTQVSLEDYEEVKNMWLKHYREAPIPFAPNISTRDEWLGSDIKKLTNISHLLGSTNPQLKQKGLDEIAEILPFLLLGGFSDVETYAYVKAKLEAAKQISDELALKEKAKEEGKSEVLEEEETLLTLDEKKQKQEKAKAASAERAFDEEKKEKEEGTTEDQEEETLLSIDDKKKKEEKAGEVVEEMTIEEDKKQ